jgi:hypothetical protein
VIGPTPPASNPKGTAAIRVDDVRELERLAALKPSEAPWKVFIVDDADRMTAATPQAFLKTLEEPPARTVIILILSQVRALPATVLSRCQVVRFRPRLVEGAPALFPEVRGEAHARSLRLLAEAREQGVEAILRLGDQVGRDRQAAELFVEACWLWHRDLLCGLAGASPRLAVFGESAAKAGGARSLDQVLGALRDCREDLVRAAGGASRPAQRRKCCWADSPGRPPDHERADEPATAAAVAGRRRPSTSSGCGCASRSWPRTT